MPLPLPPPRAFSPSRPPPSPPAQVKGFVPREEWLPFSDPELQVLATVRRWLGAARFDAVPLSRPVLVLLCEKSASSHPSL